MSPYSRIDKLKQRSVKLIIKNIFIHETFLKYLAILIDSIFVWKIYPLNFFMKLVKR